MNSIKALLLASLVAGSVAAVQAAPLKTDIAASGVSAVFKQMNVPVEAPFRTFAAQIDYDAAKPATAKAIVEITTASFDIGDAMYNKEVAKKEWFNSAQFPKATFVSTSIAPAGAGKAIQAMAAAIMHCVIFFIGAPHLYHDLQAFAAVATWHLLSRVLPIIH